MASAVIGALRVNLGIDTAAFSNGLKKAESSLQKFGNLAKKGLMAAGVAATGAAGAMSLMVRNTINSADEMAKASRSYGVPIDELSRLRYAADLSGVSFNNLGNSLRTLNKNAYDASNGTGAAKDAFAELGVSVANADGSLKSATQLMGEVADALQDIDDETRKAALSGKIFGERYGPQLASLLAGGSEGINKLTAEAETFGQVFTQAMGEQAETFNDNISRLTGTFSNIAATIATDLLPHLVRFTDWLVENAPAIQRWANVVIEQFVIFGQNLAQLKTEIDSIIAAFVAFRDGVTTAVNEVDATLRAWSEQIVGIFAAIPGQMMEIGRNIIAGLWQGILGQWEIFKADVSGLASDITNTFKSVLGIHSPSTVMAEIGRNIMQGLSQGMEEMKGSVSGTVGSIVGGIENAFSSLGSSIAEAIRGTKEWKDVALDAIRAVANAILSSMSFGGGFFGTLFKGLLGGLVGFANGGSFTVGGTGGIDSQLVAFRATPGEMVDIRKPGQDRGGSLHITFGLASDGALNIMPEVRSVSREESMAATEGLAKRVPAMVDRRDNVRNTRGTRA